MFDVVEQGVLQACLPDGAIGANALGDLYADPIAGKERLRRVFPALALRHPGDVQHIGSFLGSALRRGNVSGKRHRKDRDSVPSSCRPRPDGFVSEAASPL
jgi:hypothetical protein